MRKNIGVGWGAGEGRGGGEAVGWGAEWGGKGVGWGTEEEEEEWVKKLKEEEWFKRCNLRSWRRKRRGRGAGGGGKGVDWRVWGGGMGDWVGERRRSRLRSWRRRKRIGSRSWRKRRRSGAEEGRGVGWGAGGVERGLSWGAGRGEMDWRAGGRGGVGRGAGKEVSWIFPLEYRYTIKRGITIISQRTGCLLWVEIPVHFGWIKQALHHNHQHYNWIRNVTVQVKLKSTIHTEWPQNGTHHCSCMIAK